MSVEQGRSEGLPDVPSKPRRTVYDLVVVGSGPAGISAASAAARLGHHVALIGPVGSAHRHRSDAATTVHLLRDATRNTESCGGGSQEPADARSVDFAAAMERVRRAHQQAAGRRSREQLEALGIDVYPGKGLFTSPEVVMVEGTRLRFRRAILATGARLLRPKIEGLAQTECLDSLSVAGLDALPRRLAVLGTDAGACFFAQVFRRLGSQVHLAGREASILSTETPAVAGVLHDQLERDGVRLHLDCDRLAVETAGNRRAVLLGSGSQRQKLFGEKVFCDGARVPDTEAVGLEAAGLALDTSGSGVLIDDRARTTNRRIYAAGAVCTQQVLWPEAARATARLAVGNALGVRRRRLSRLIFARSTATNPEIAQLGLTPTEAADRAVPIETYRADAEGVLLGTGAEEFLVVHIGPSSGRVIGALAVAQQTAELLGPLMLLMRSRLPITAVEDIIADRPGSLLLLRKAAQQYADSFPPGRWSRLVRRWRQWLGRLPRQPLGKTAEKAT